MPETLIHRQVVSGDCRPHSLVDNIRRGATLHGSRLPELLAHLHDGLAVAFAVVPNPAYNTGGGEGPYLMKDERQLPPGALRSIVSKGPHKRPAQAQALRDGRVDIFGTAKTILPRQRSTVS